MRSGHLDILPETTIVASGSVSANPGEAHVSVSEAPLVVTVRPPGAGLTVAVPVVARLIAAS